MKNKLEIGLGEVATGGGSYPGLVVNAGSYPCRPDTLFPGSGPVAGDLGLEPSRLLTQAAGRFVPGRCGNTSLQRVPTPHPCVFSKASLLVIYASLLCCSAHYGGRAGYHPIEGGWWSRGGSNPPKFAWLRAKMTDSPHLDSTVTRLG